MKRLTLIVGLIVAIGALAHYVATHPSRDRVESLRTEHESLRQQNERLADENERLRREIVALRNDPRLAERRAREQAGLARPDELILQFDRSGSEDRRLQVELTVGAQRMELAGESVDFGGLDARLATLREDLPDARLNVTFAREVGPLRRERVITIVDGSKFAPVEYRTAEK